MKTGVGNARSMILPVGTVRDMGMYQIMYRICEVRTVTITAPSEIEAESVLQKTVFSQNDRINTFEICCTERLDW